MCMDTRCVRGPASSQPQARIEKTKWKRRGRGGGVDVHKDPRAAAYSPQTRHGDHTGGNTPCDSRPSYVELRHFTEVRERLRQSGTDSIEGDCGPEWGSGVGHSKGAERQGVVKGYRGHLLWA